MPTPSSSAEPCPFWSHAPSPTPQQPPTLPAARAHASHLRRGRWLTSGGHELIFSNSRETPRRMYTAVVCLVANMSAADITAEQFYVLQLQDAWGTCLAAKANDAVGGLYTDDSALVIDGVRSDKLAGIFATIKGFVSSPRGVTVGPKSPSRRVHSAANTARPLCRLAARPWASRYYVEHDGCTSRPCTRNCQPRDGAPGQLGAWRMASPPPTSDRPCAPPRALQTCASHLCRCRLSPWCFSRCRAAASARMCGRRCVDAPAGSVGPRASTVANGSLRACCFVSHVCIAHTRHAACCL